LARCRSPVIAASTGTAAVLAAALLYDYHLTFRFLGKPIGMHLVLVGMQNRTF
jgi:hypothetical protein